MEKTPTVAGWRPVVAILEAGGHADPKPAAVDNCIEIVHVDLLVEDVIDGSIQGDVLAEVV